MRRLEEARKALKLALEELERYRKDREGLRLRNACEKGWLAVILATDTLLVSSGYKKPESYSERRRALEDLEVRYPKVSELGLRDRFGARGYYLHVQGYHEGMLSDIEVERELAKVKEYIDDVEEILRGAARSRQGHQSGETGG